MMAFDVKGTFTIVDSMDPDRFAGLFTEDGVFRFGNWPTVKGRSEIAAFVAEFFTSIKALKHRVTDSWRVEGGEIAEVEVTYTRHDDSAVDLTAACIFRLQNDEIADYRIYMDVNPLFATTE
jgi:limonene-1,2-epoxide hydrolase